MAPPERLPDPAGFAAMLPSFDQFGAGTPPVAEAAARAEALDFDAAFVGDHLRARCPNLDAPLALAAAAGRTERIRLGFAIMLLALRHPVWTAKALGTLDALAPGRIVLGVGVGGEYEDEWEATGVPIAQRGRRTDELLPVVQALLCGEGVDHPGPLAPLRSPALAPVPGHRLPVMIGGRSDHAIARAARLGDAWHPVWMSDRRLAAGIAHLDELTEQLGRPRLAVPLMVFACVTDDAAAARRTADRYLHGQYRLSIERAERWCAIGDADEVAERLQGHLDAGATGLVLIPLSDHPLDQLERLAELRERLSALDRGSHALT